MKRFLNLKIIGISVVFSTLLIILVQAATPYTVSITSFNDSEFPRVQVAMNISGDTGALLAKHIDILEGDKVNIGPKVLLPPKTKSGLIDLHILIDSSEKLSDQASIIQNNLKGLVQYFYESEMLARVTIESFDGSQSDSTNDLQGAVNKINAFDFNAPSAAKIDGFGKIVEVASQQSNQKVLLIVNGSSFDDNPDHTKMIQAFSQIEREGIITFVLGHPIRAMHAVRPDDLQADFIDFSHSVPGGYLGSFGADLTSMVDLLKMQSTQDFVLQYYSTQPSASFTGSQAVFQIDKMNVENFIHTSSNNQDVIVSHLPDNELVAGEDVPIEVDLANYGNMINSVELNYANAEGSIDSIPLVHQRSADTEASLKYSVDIPSALLGAESFFYYFSINTPYISKNGVAYTIPVASYDDGITLTPTLVNGVEVLWRWEGPTVSRGKRFEIWDGETLLATTDEKHFTIPLDECNRYQIVQVKVIFDDSTQSYPSEPYEYYADQDDDELITERDGVSLMINCIQDKEIDNYTRIAASDGFDASANMSLERAGVYLAKIIAEDIWQKVEGQSGYYEQLYYIMIFIDREEYINHGVDKLDINKSLIYKFITQVNNTDDVNAVYDRALAELTNRLRATLSL